MMALQQCLAAAAAVMLLHDKRMQPLSQRTEDAWHGITRCLRLCYMTLYDTATTASSYLCSVVSPISGCVAHRVTTAQGTLP